MSGLLELEGVCKAFGQGNRREHVLTDVSLTVGAGEIVGVLSHRFGGKTTLLRLAGGLERPTRGQVRFDGADLASLGSAGRERLLGGQIAWCDRSEAGLRLTVRDFVAMPLLLGRRADRKSPRTLADQALERVGAQACEALRWQDLSSWQRVLVTLARGIVCGPRLLLIDDLLDGFGMLVTRDAGDLLHSIADDLSCAVLLTVSDEEPALAADRVYRLQDGKMRLTSDISLIQEGKVIEFPGPRRPRSMDV